MKIKVLSTIIILSASFTAAKAQIEKGGWMTGGLIHYSNSNSKTDLSAYEFSQKLKNGTFEVAAGYIFKENQAIGLVMSYANSSNTYKSTESIEGGQETTSKGIGGFYRLYQPLGHKFYVYGQASAMYTHGKMETPGQYKYTGYTHTADVGVSPGISYEVLKNIQLEIAIPNIVALNYSKTKGEIEGQSTEPGRESFSVNTGLNGDILKSLGFGFKIFL